MKYQLAVDDAKVYVWQGDNYWQWSFSYNDGSGYREDWNTTEAAVKREAKGYYQLYYPVEFRAKWIKVR